MKPHKNTQDTIDPKAHNYYSEQGLWSKIKRFATNIGNEALEKVLILYYCFQDPQTPRKEKTIILGALGYFIMPFDAIPDLLPGGFVDDLGILALAFAKITRSIKDEHIQKAKEKLNKMSAKS